MPIAIARSYRDPDFRKWAGARFTVVTLPIGVRKPQARNAMITRCLLSCTAVSPRPTMKNLASVEGCTPTSTCTSSAVTPKVVNDVSCVRVSMLEIGEKVYYCTPHGDSRQGTAFAHRQGRRGAC